MDQFWNKFGQIAVRISKLIHFRFEKDKKWTFLTKFTKTAISEPKSLKKTTFLRKHIIVRMYLMSIQSPFTILTRTWIIYLFKNMRRAHRHIYHCTLQMTCQFYFTTNDLWYPIIENKTGCLVISISVLSAYTPKIIRYRYVLIIPYNFWTRVM